MANRRDVGLLNLHGMMDSNDQITTNFRVVEFERSVTAALYGYENFLRPDLYRNVERLCVLFLQPLRDKLKCPIHITSGYRCRDLNKKVGGSETSWHMQGCAADFHPNDPDLRQEVIDFARSYKEWHERWQEDPDHVEEPPVKFTEFIIYPKFFHVAVAPEGTANRYVIKTFNEYGQGYHKD